MREKLQFSALAVALCVSLLLGQGCDRQRLDLQEGSFEVFFVLDGGGAETTRSTAVADETYLDEWCLYVVDRNGVVCDAVVSGSPTVSGRYPAGAYTAYAVVNCAATEDTFTVEEDIYSSRRCLYEETEAFSMFGSNSFVVPQDDNCPIAVKRLVSKVEIRSISTDFSQYLDLASETFIIDSIYLINIAGETSLASDESFLPATWYNRRVFAHSGIDVLVCDSVGVAISTGIAYTTPHYFYCYQNTAEADSHSPAWSPRHTRLVLECTLAGQKTYYPIDIAGPEGTLARNTRYLITDLVITDIGSDAPDEPVTGSLPYRFSTLVTSWDGTYYISEEL